MKSKILDIHGKEKGSIELPKAFSETVREDIIAKVIEAKKTRQPYSPSPVGGKQHSASGKIKHLRHVWKSSYGRGMSRVPRKIMTRRGSQFNWVAAEIPSAVGGRRAHPPKAISMINTKRINKKEMVLALKGALSATANEKIVSNRYERLKDKKISGLPIIVESKIISLKTKELISSLKNILGEVLFEVSLKKRKIRSGKGKLRGRKYKKSLGLLLVTGNKEKIRTNAIDVRNAKELNVTDLADGGAGRLTIYTEEAIKNLGERIK
ncbi:50S ribosomal protein L4 [Candidatus Pacearchaeota archaeon RBG_19FT_COMBO_34_9]|nr:50S ribosomal protein L4P, large subunit ribosomal protein L4e [uncultured archaeon]OGJ13080.1 MAG: 50S ribosomal protein L4 [Candidatus Pacearchaeota archaeon RBG_19FT_COMBO_34_9]OGJ16171.1 MAG: 50S ribosomal protein L4 [Candidatus Pacearchaeota archaeon RBG_13_33_26]